MPWGAVAGAVIGAVASNSAAKKGANASKKANDASIAEQQRQFDLTRKDQMPWLQAGGSALGQMQALNAGDFSSFKQSPDYQFTLDQSIQGADRSAAARGGLYSGGHQADLLSLAGGLASQQYGNYYNRLSNLAGVGQTTASGLGQLGMVMANQNGAALQNAGQARASSFAQQGQNYSELANGLGGLYGYYHNRNQTPSNYVTGTGGSGMSYTAPATAGGNSWMNAYGAGNH